MKIDLNNIFTMTEANQNFSKVTKSIEVNGQAVIIKNSKPKYIVMDIEKNGYLLNITENELFLNVAKNILYDHISAFRELAQ